MKNVITILFVTLMSLKGLSQMKLSENYSYKVSEPYRVFDADQKVYFANGNESLAIKIDEDDVMIQKFNSQKPAFIGQKKYEKVFPKHFVIEGVSEVDNHYYIFYSSWDGDNEKEQLFALEVDFAKGELNTNPKLVLQVNGKIAGTMVATGFSVKVINKFDFFMSHDKKSMLVKYRKKPEVKSDVKSYDILGLNLYDGGLKKISTSEVTMPYTERRMDNLDYQLDNKGNLYLLTKIFNDDSYNEKKKSKDKDLVANYHIELLFIKAGSNKIEISKLDNKEKFINRISLFDTPNDFLVCGGFYSTGKGSYDDIDGIVAFKVSSEGKIYEPVYHEIPLEILNQYESSKTVKKNEKKERKKDDAMFNDLYLDGLTVNSDGSIVLVAEQYFTITHYSAGMNGRGGTTRTTYHYCDVLVTKIGVKGELAWMKKIPKNQVGGAGQGGMSYKHFVANGSHYIVYLDNVKNIDLGFNEVPKRHTDRKGGYLTSVKIDDATGALSKGSILNVREIEDFELHQFSTNRIFKTSENSFMFESYKKKKEDVMINVTLK